MANWNFTSLAIGVFLAAAIVALVLVTRQSRPGVGLPDAESQVVDILSPSFVPLPAGNAPSDSGAGLGDLLDEVSTSLAAGSGADQSDGPPVPISGDDIPLQSTKAVRADVRQLFQLLHRDAIVPIYNPEFSSASDANISSRDLVIGVEIDGDSRAYPIGPLRAREMVNDVVAGVPILVTWWPICYTGLVHDRRINGSAHTFGNQGALFRRAMTWWDHETGSIWSQPWGLAIGGQLEGVRLTQVPAVIIPWDAWLAEHPDTLVLEDRRSGFGSLRQKFDSDFVIGIALGEEAKAYPFNQASNAGVLNDQLGRYPVLVIANAETKFVETFLRLVGETELEFSLVGDKLVDTQTGSTWDAIRGIAVSGPLRGQVLQRVPYTTAYDWAWKDFYPHTEFYRGQ